MHFIWHTDKFGGPSDDICHPKEYTRLVTWYAIYGTLANFTTKIKVISFLIFIWLNSHSHLRLTRKISWISGNSGSACQRDWQKVFDCAESFLWQFLLKSLKINDDYSQKIWYVINNTENVLPKMLYIAGFYKFPPKWELFFTISRSLYGLVYIFLDHFSVSIVRTI